jgi:hypothetical protein
LDHPPHSPGLVPSDSHLFIYVKNWTESQRFNNKEELKESAKTWLSLQAAEIFDTGIQNLILQYDKCLNSDDD